MSVQLSVTTAGSCFMTSSGRLSHLAILDTLGHALAHAHEAKIREVEIKIHGDMPPARMAADAAPKAGAGILGELEAELPKLVPLLGQAFADMGNHAHEAAAKHRAARQAADEAAVRASALDYVDAHPEEILSRLAGQVPDLFARIQNILRYQPTGADIGEAAAPPADEPTDEAQAAASVGV